MLCRKRFSSFPACRGGKFVFTVFQTTPPSNTFQFYFIFIYILFFPQPSLPTAATKCYAKPDEMTYRILASCFSASIFFLFIDFPTLANAHTTSYIFIYTVRKNIRYSRCAFWKNIHRESINTTKLIMIIVNLMIIEYYFTITVIYFKRNFI